MSLVVILVIVLTSTIIFCLSPGDDCAVLIKQIEEKKIN